MAGELGKASLSLEAELSRFESNIESGKRTASGMGSTLEHVAAIADLATHALNDVGLSASKAAESRTSAEAILSGVRGISEESLVAAREIDRVKLTEEQAAESEASGGLINHVLNAISRNADEAKRKLTEVKVEGGVPGRSGVGVGPFGSGFGRIGAVGTAVGAAALTGPAAAPAAVGLLASIPTLAAGAAGALGVLALAFSGVFKAIGGSKKAFDDLGPSARQFVLLVRSLDGWLDKLKQTAGAALFPGLTAGLKSALSPGTVAAITKAVTEFGHAIGEAGAMWGRYFGSREFQSILGPLMKSGARNLGVLSDALLHLFDALGVIARAAIPFTNWLTSAADKGAKLVDSWIHAKDATGALGGAMKQAETSLRLVGGLLEAAGKAVFALGAALYPVAKVAVKLLTDGLDALAGGIRKAAPDIRSALSGVISLIGDVAKVVGPTLGTLADSVLKLVGTLSRALAPVVKDLQPIFGALRTVIAEITPPLQKVIKDLVGSLEPAVKALAKPMGDLIQALGPVLVGALKVLDPLLRFAAWGITQFAKIFGVLLEAAATSLTWIEKHWNGIGDFFKALGHEIVNALEYAWYLIEKGALVAALKVVEPFSHLPSFLGGWARKAKNSMQGQLDKLHPPNMAWGAYAAASGAAAGAAWSDAFNSAARSGTKARASAIDAYYGLRSHDKRKRHDRKPPSTALPPGSVFGKPPPFKNPGGTSGSHSAIPQPVSQLDAQAARQDQQASALNYAGAKARKHLETEIVDYQKADKILEEKLKTAHGKKRTALYNALTSNLKHIAEARKRMGEALTKGQQASLNLALDQSKVAVEKAQQGSKAWDAAIKREEAALKAEIAYWDKRAHNDKLSAAARDAALKQELSYEKQLKALTTATAQAAAANEAQFLSTFAAIQNTFGYNAVPIAGNGNGGTGKTDTHLHDIKQETRQTNRHLKAIRDGGRFVHSPQAREAAMAVG